MIKSQKGQSIVLITIMLIALVAMLTLVLDGGFAYFQRRNAQNAADAGALAGARQLCQGYDAATAYNSAREYACTRNGADPPPDTIINVDAAAKRVSVTASITFDTFFARLFGTPQTTARASASAGCFRPCYADRVLPIVWSCRPPVDPSLSSSVDCQQQRITLAQAQIYAAENPLRVHPQLYVVMDSLTYGSDVMCIQDPDYDPSLPYTFIDCDFDGDGEADFLASGGRSWVDLDGANLADNCPPASGEGSSELNRWITNGYDCELVRHLWVAQQSGVTTNVFDAVYNIWQSGRRYVLVPVFNDMCEPGDPRTECADRVHAQDDYHEISGNQPYFHIIDFAAFYITCVKVNPSDSCPGQRRFAELNGQSGLRIYNNGELNSMRSVEGYFVDGIPDDTSGKCTGGVDTGVYTLYLDP